MTEDALQGTPVALLPAAAARLQPLLRGSGPTPGIRVTIEPGGCSGLRYGVTFDDAPTASDIVVRSHGIEIRLDRTSAPYLSGALIDYSETGFSVRNPAARGACACGGSFVPRGETG